MAQESASGHMGVFGRSAVVRMSSGRATAAPGPGRGKAPRVGGGVTTFSGLCRHAERSYFVSDEIQSTSCLHVRRHTHTHMHTPPTVTQHTTQHVHTQHEQHTNAPVHTLKTHTCADTHTHTTNNTQEFCLSGICAESGGWVLACGNRSLLLGLAAHLCTERGRSGRERDCVCIHCGRRGGIAAFPKPLIVFFFFSFAVCCAHGGIRCPAHTIVWCVSDPTI